MALHLAVGSQTCLLKSLCRAIGIGWSSWIIIERIYWQTYGEARQEYEQSTKCNALFVLMIRVNRLNQWQFSELPCRCESLLHILSICLKLSKSFAVHLVMFSRVELQSCLKETKASWGHSNLDFQYILTK